jgi:cell volume regulation protein A
VDELVHFGAWVALVSAAALAAVVSSRLAERIRVPPGAVFLLVAAIASDLFPTLAHHLSTRSVERLASVSLAVILFDGGLRVGWRRFRDAAVPIVLLGLVGTFVTAGLLTLVAHAVVGFGWATSGVLGAALAPTDPAIMFSVLGRREIAGRTGTILEGESGANDPVGIALTLAMISAAGGSGSAGGAIGDFVSSLLIGLVIGAVAGALHPLLVRLPLREASLGPLRTLAFVGVVYGVASAAHGSGFLAVFVAGILVGDARFPGKRAVARFHTSLASLAEIVVFVALGLTIHLGSVFHEGVWWEGLVLALAGAFVIRPLAVGPLLLPVELTAGERLFVIWAGLKGAVPILLAAFALLGGVDHAERIYLIVFVVVALSVTVQAATIPSAARRFGVPMLELRDRVWE